ncbi:MAG: hypothetical protein RLZZ241_1707 [Bacteroidota bacterium]|jgi:hypothetical protein
MRCFTKLISLSSLLVILLGCDVSDDSATYDLIALPISEVNLPDTFKLNERYIFNISFVRPDDCTGFRGFETVAEETETHTVRHIMAIGAQFHDGLCPEAPETLQTSIQFICQYSSPYLFRFYTGEDAYGNPQYLEIEVPVE